MAKSDKKIIITNRVFIPEEMVSKSRVEKRFSTPLFNDEMCNSCIYASQRPCGPCDTCAGYIGVVNLWKMRQTSEGVYIGIPTANWRKALDAFGISKDVYVEDRRPLIKIKSGLRFTKRLFDETDVGRANQKEVVEQFMHYSKDRDYCGTINAPPRSGKTAMSLYIAINLLKRKTLITGAQFDWLKSFCEDLSFMTNMTELSDKGKTPVVMVSSHKEASRLEKIGVKVVKSWSKVPNECDIVLSTYLMCKHKKDEDRSRPSSIVKKYIMGKFTTLIVDEAHKAGAQVLSQFIASLDVTHRIALSATPDRKDGMSFIVYRLMGPVSAISTVPTMVPKFTLLETGISKPPETIKAGSAGASYYETWLTNNEERNKLIVKQVFKDLKNPRHNILISVRRLNQANILMRMINQTAAAKNMKGEKWPERLAAVFTGKSDRTQTIEDAKNEKLRVVVAIENIVKHNLSVPAWTHVYTNVSPISNGSGFYQLYSRVSTPRKGKPQPVVRHLIDATSASVKGLINLYNSQYDSLRSALEDRPARLIMDAEEKERMFFIMSRPYAYFGPGKDNQLNRVRRARVVGGFGSKRAKDAR